MAQPTMFVMVDRLGHRSDSLADLKTVIGMLAKSAGALLVDKLVNEQEVEADIAFVITVESALRFLKETERTIVFIGYLGTSGSYTSKEEALAFAVRFPQRVKVGPFVENTGEENLMTTLMRTISEMGKEKRRTSDEDPSRRRQRPPPPGWQKATRSSRSRGSRGE